MNSISIRYRSEFLRCNFGQASLFSSFGRNFRKSDPLQNLKRILVSQARFLTQNNFLLILSSFLHLHLYQLLCFQLDSRICSVLDQKIFLIGDFLFHFRYPSFRTFTCPYFTLLKSNLLLITKSTTIFP